MRNRPRGPFPTALCVAFAATMLGCGDDAGSAGSTADDDDDGTGFADTTGTTRSASESSSEPSSSTESTTMSGTASTTTNDATTQGTDTGTTQSDSDTLGEGNLRGLLTFTLYPADALIPDDIVGLAGAWREARSELTDVDDFFAVFGLGRRFPPPPPEVDAIEQNGIPDTFDWGAPFDWLLAGNAMKLQLGEDAALACLLYRGGSPEVELPPKSGMFYPNYPVYAATNSPSQPNGCQPDPAMWLPDTEYDLVLYGGEMFDTNVLAGRVHTPPALEVTAPDVSLFGIDIDVGEDLEVVWTGEATDESRIIIRVWDAFDRMITAHAADDGSYTIPADDLGSLAVGTATISVAREHIETVGFTEGTVRVVTRYEQWGYLELF